jgi:hypothetical protein
MADSDSDDDVLFAIWNKQTHFLISAAAAATSSHDDMEATVQQCEWFRRSERRACQAGCYARHI